MKNKEIDDIIRQKLSNINYEIDAGEVEKVHQFVRSKQFWWQKYYWTNTTSYLLAASLLVASLSYNLYQHRNAENLKAELHQILAEKPTGAPVMRNIISDLEGETTAPSTATETPNKVATENRYSAEPTLTSKVIKVKSKENLEHKLDKYSSKENAKFANKNTIRNYPDSKITADKRSKGHKNDKGEGANEPTRGIGEVNASNQTSVASVLASDGLPIVDAAQSEQVGATRMEEVMQLTVPKMPYLVRPIRKLEALYSYYPLPRKIKPVVQHNFGYRVGLQGVATSYSNAVGVRGELWWKSHWSIAAGLQYRTAKPSRFDDEIHFNKDNGTDFNKEYPNHPPPPVGGKLFDIQLKQSFLEVPIAINYAYPLGGGHALMASVGSSLILKKHNSVDFRFQPVGNPSNQPRMKADRVDKSLVVGKFCIGMGYQYVYKHLALQVMPQLELPTKKTRVNEPGIDLGIRAAALYTF